VILGTALLATGCRSDVSYLLDELGKPIEGEAGGTFAMYPSTPRPVHSVASTE